MRFLPTPHVPHNWESGLWFEEFETGVLYLHRPGRTITEADNVLFTTLTMNTQALHLDAAYVTADRRFWRKATARHDLSDRVVLLSDRR